MYEQVNKTKENSLQTNRQESRAVANFVVQKKSNGKQGFGFVDNRPETIVQRKMYAVISAQKHTLQTNTIQASRELGRRPGSPHTATPSTILNTSYHHLVPYSRLRMISADLTSNPGHQDAVIYMRHMIASLDRVTVENLANLRLLKKEWGEMLGNDTTLDVIDEKYVTTRINGSDGTNAWEKIKDFKEKYAVSSGATGTEVSELDLGERGDEILSMIAWSPGNLVEGPGGADRKNEPKDKFDYEATTLLTEGAHRTAVHEISEKAKDYHANTRDTRKAASLEHALNNYAPYKNVKTTIDVRKWQKDSSTQKYETNPVANTAWKEN